MASISLMLKDNNALAKTRIIAKLTDGRAVQIKISSSHSVYPKHWNKKNNTVLSADSNAIAINTDLKKLKEKILSIYSDAKAKGIIADREYITNILTPTEKAKNLNTEFWNVFDYYLEDKKSTFKAHSFVKFNALKTHLENFEIHRKTPLKLETITQKVISDLQIYFYEVAKLNTQTTSKYLGVFKMFLNWSISNKYTTNNDFKYFKIKHQPDTQKAVFTDEDLQKLRAFNSKEKQYLNNVRDLVILSCLTGLRYSDYSAIKPQHIEKIGINEYNLRLMQKKTNDYVEIPLTDESYSIIQKLFNKEIHAISNQKMNTYVKDVCELCKINEDFEKIEFRGNLKTTKTVPKYELITTHTGRRTFATNLLLKGVSAEVVMLFTGHRDYKSFSKYVNIPKASKMAIVRQALIG